MSRISYLGNLRRECHHVMLHRDGRLEDEYEPTMVLFLEGRFGKCAMIPLEAAYKYDEPETQDEKHLAMMHCAGIARHLGIDTNPRSLAQLAMFIQDGISDLLSMPPYREEEKTVGEVELLVNGERVSREVTMTESELAVGE